MFITLSYRQSRDVLLLKSSTRGGWDEEAGGQSDGSPLITYACILDPPLLLLSLSKWIKSKSKWKLCRLRCYSGHCSRERAASSEQERAKDRNHRLQMAVLLQFCGHNHTESLKSCKCNKHETLVQLYWTCSEITSLPHNDSFKRHIMTPWCTYINTFSSCVVLSLP